MSPLHHSHYGCMTGDGFSVAFDPLDGSSIVDTNFSVGTIFGIWPGDKLVGITGRDQVRRDVGGGFISCHPASLVHHCVCCTSPCTSTFFSHPSCHHVSSISAYMFYVYRFYIN